MKVAGRPRRTGATSVSGDAALSAFDALYRAFFVRLVRRAAWRFGLSKEDACEVVQDAFMIALVKLDTEGEAGPWLYRTVDNLAVNWKRKASRRARLMAEWGSAGDVEQAESEGGEP